jgi:multicomponent Na+:H+ antiporter subunit E
MAPPVASLAWRAAIGRAVALMGLWVVFGGVGSAHLLVGLPAVAAATMASLRLLPPQPVRPRPLALAALLPRFCAQSVLAGLQVARLAFHPAMPLRPGFAIFRGILPAGPGRDGFLAWSSLMPGTLPAGQSGDGAVSVHCLDIGSPAAPSMAAEEERFAHALGLEVPHG